MKNKLYTEKGFSLADVGKMFGKKRQTVHLGFSRRGYKMRTIKQLPFLSFNGNKYTLRNNGYYARTDGKRILMHRDVWRYYKGKIPPKHDLHHIDHDKANNNIINLELYTKSEHAKKFATGNNQYGKNNR